MQYMYKKCIPHDIICLVKDCGNSRSLAFKPLIGSGKVYFSFCDVCVAEIRLGLVMVNDGPLSQHLLPQVFV